MATRPVAATILLGSTNPHVSANGASFQRKGGAAVLQRLHRSRGGGALAGDAQKLNGAPDDSHRQQQRDGHDHSQRAELRSQHDPLNSARVGNPRAGPPHHLVFGAGFTGQGPEQICGDDLEIVIGCVGKPASAAHRRGKTRRWSKGDSNRWSPLRRDWPFEEVPSGVWLELKVA